MDTLFRYHAPADQCGYLPDQTWRLEYEFVRRLTPAEYQERMQRGWRRFGVSLFHPLCPQCTACRALRVLVNEFRPNRSQRRVQKRNEGLIRIEIGRPAVSRAKLELYDRYHARQSAAKGWPLHPADDARSYAQSFVENPFPTEEWCYYLEDRLVGVSYVDVLPGAISAIYCFYDPELRDYSLGTWNVLSVLAGAIRREVPYIYLGYYVKGCPSMEYKARFAPNELLGSDGKWQAFVNRNQAKAGEGRSLGGRSSC
jgi:arginine-tRNA-protein transferase